MDKYQRNYSIRVNTANSGTIAIKPPFTIEFDVMTNAWAQVSNVTIRIYNLSEAVRASIVKDTLDTTIYRMFEFKAGYGDDMPLIFYGNVRACYSQRIGTEFVTTIEGWDGQYATINAYSSRSYSAGVLMTKIIRDLISDLHAVDININEGAISKKFDYEVKGRGISFHEKTYLALQRVTNGGFYIDKGLAFAVDEKDAIQGGIPVLELDKGGLLGTPMREANFLTVNMLFEPRLMINQRIRLKSTGAKYWDGDYKILSISHKGTISESVCGNAVTVAKFEFDKNRDVPALVKRLQGYSL